MHQVPVQSRRANYKFGQENQLVAEASAAGSRRIHRLGSDSAMPELSRFFGIIVRMYMEANEPHHLAHFHAYYQHHAAVVSLDPIELIAGSLPRRQRRLVEA